MRAIQFERFGPAREVLHLVDLPVPAKKKGEVIIKVYSTSINPVDWKTRKGLVPSFLVRTPKTPGGDVAGVVVECEENSKNFAVGDRVFACTDGFKLWRREGSYCEYVSAPESQVAKLPPNVSLEIAGGLPLVSLTAWQALEAIDLSEGQCVLIHGGAGGVGSMCIQLAKARGLKVIVTCSGGNYEHCRALGADHCIDYTTQDFAVELQDSKLDGIIDLIGGSVEVKSLRLLDACNPKAPFCSVLNSGFSQEHGMAAAGILMLWSLLKSKVKSIFGYGNYTLLMVRPSGKQLTEVAKLLEAGRIRPVVEHVLPLEKAAEGHEYLEQGHARGKVILSVHNSYEESETLKLKLGLEAHRI